MPKKSKKNYNKNKNINKNNIKININTGSKKRRTTNSAPVPRHAQPIIINNGSNNNQHELMHLLNNFKKDLDESNRVKTNNFINPNTPTQAIIQTHTPHTTPHTTPQPTPQPTPYTTPRLIPNVNRHAMEEYVNQLMAQPRVQPRLTPQATPQATPRFVTPREETPRFVTPRETPRETPRVNPQPRPTPPRPTAAFLGDITHPSPHSPQFTPRERPSTVFLANSPHPTNPSPMSTPNTSPRPRPEVPALDFSNLGTTTQSPIAHMSSDNPRYTPHNTTRYSPLIAERLSRMRSDIPRNTVGLNDMINPENDAMDRGYDSSDDEEEKDFNVVNEIEQHDIANLSNSSSNPKNYLDEPDTDEDEDPNNEAKKNFLHYLQVHKNRSKQKRTEEEQTNKEGRKGFRHHHQPLMNKLNEFIKNNTDEHNKESKLTKNQLAELNELIDDPTQKIKHSKKSSTIRNEYNEYLDQISPPQTTRQQSTRVLRSHTYNKNDKQGPG